jgi:hypothetical protein
MLRVPSNLKIVSRNSLSCFPWVRYPTPSLSAQACTNAVSVLILYVVRLLFHGLPASAQLLQAISNGKLQDIRGMVVVSDILAINTRFLLLFWGWLCRLFGHGLNRFCFGTTGHPLTYDKIYILVRPVLRADQACGHTSTSKQAQHRRRRHSTSHLESSHIQRLRSQLRVAGGRSFTRGTQNRFKPSCPPSGHTPSAPYPHTRRPSLQLATFRPVPGEGAGRGARSWPQNPRRPR